MKTLLRLLVFPACFIFSSAALIAQNSVRIVNQSVRGPTSRNGHKLIMGFALNEDAHRILIRAIGPALEQFGITAPASDPRFSVMNSSGAVIASNDDWDARLATTFMDAGAFALRNGSKDASLLLTLDRGTYTVLVENVSDTDAIALIEIYDLDASPNGLVNVSIRGWSGPGQAAIVPGITIRGTGSSSIMFRELGPALKQFGINDYLPDPLLTVRQGPATLGSATDWQNWINPAVFLSVGAFPLVLGSNDAVYAFKLDFSGSASGKEVQITLTATAGSVSDASGEVVVETYIGWHL